METSQEVSYLIFDFTSPITQPTAQKEDKNPVSNFAEDDIITEESRGTYNIRVATKSIVDGEMLTD